MKIAYFDCFSGVSGDMILGALLDAGLSPSFLNQQLGKLGLVKRKVKKRRVRRGNIVGTKFELELKKSKKSSRTLKEIFELIDRSGLTEAVKGTCKHIFSSLAKAESKVHGSDVHKTRLHEVGQDDSIIDVVGAVIGLNGLGVEEVYSSPISFGKGFVQTETHSLPLPAPATINLSKGAPVIFTDVEEELTTPTGMAIIKTLSKGFGQIPAVEVFSVGYGAGCRDNKTRPNLLRVIIGEKVTKGYEGDRITIVEANIDDMNPQNYEHLSERLFKTGALDVYYTPVHMKKSRPGILLTVLLEPRLLDKVCSVIFEETTSFGLRFYDAQRRKLIRKTGKVKTRFGEVGVKLGSLNGRVQTASLEYDDCKRLAQKWDIPLRRIHEEANKKLCKSLDIKSDI